MTDGATADVVVAGAGFVGSYVARACVERGLAVRMVDRRPNGLAAALGVGSEVEACDLTDRAQVAELLGCARPELLVVAASFAPDEAQPELRQLIAAAHDAGTARLVLVSSLAVYGDAAPLDGGLPESTVPVNPSPYGRAKLGEERAALEAAAPLGSSVLILRSTGVFGRLVAPRESSRAAGAIDRVLRQQGGAPPATLVVEDRDDQYLYAGDLGAVIAQAVRDAPPFEVMNVGPGRLVSVEELRSELEAVLGRPVGLERVQPTGRAIQTLDIDRLERWSVDRGRHRGDLRAGLERAAADFAGGWGDP